MKLLFVFGTLLTIVFGFSLATYLVNYKTKLKNPLLKAAGFLTIGTLITAVTFILAIIVAWPPYY